MSIASLKQPISLRFRLNKIAETQNDSQGFEEVLLNEQGQVAFSIGNQNADQDTTQITGVFVGDSKRTRPIAEIRGGRFTTFGDLDFNDQGTVAFATGNEDLERITGIFTGNRKATQTIVNLQSLPNLFTNISPPLAGEVIYNFNDEIALSNNGNVLFGADVSYFANGAIQTNTRLFLSENGTIRQLAEASGVRISGFSSSTGFSDLQINDRNQTLYVRNLIQLTPRPITRTTIVFDGKEIANAGSAPGQPFTERISSPILNDAGSVFYARSGSAFQTITEVDANNLYRFDTGATAPVRLSNQRLNVDRFTVNDPGTVVFSGSTPDQSGLFVLNQGTVTRISDQLAANALINNSGEIVFQPDATTPTGIFARIGATNQSVIAPGDVIRGSTVQQVQLRDLNNSGQIAFSVNFTNGKQGLFRADTKVRSSSYSEETSLDGSARLWSIDSKVSQDPLALTTVLPASSIL